MGGGQVISIFVSVFVVPFLLVPAVGGGAVNLSYQLARLPRVPFFKCWKVYLASCCYAFLALIVVGFFLRRDALSPEAAQNVRRLVFCGMQLVLIPLLLRNFSRRALLATGSAILVTNVAAYLLLKDFQLG